MRRLALGAATVAALFAAVALSGGDARSVGTATTDPQAADRVRDRDGTVTTVPDTAGFTFGVVTRAPTAKAAQATNAAAADKVVARAEVRRRRRQGHPDPAGLAQPAHQPGRHRDHRLRGADDASP